MPTRGSLRGTGDNLGDAIGGDEKIRNDLAFRDHALPGGLGTAAMGGTGAALCQQFALELGLRTPSSAMVALNNANSSRWTLMRMPRSGYLHDISMLVGGTLTSTWDIGIYDTGQLVNATFTRIWCRSVNGPGTYATSGATTGDWNIVADPGIPVTGGQLLYFMVCGDTTAATYLTSGAAGPPSHLFLQLPTNFITLPGGITRPKLLALKDSAGATCPASATDASITVNGNSPMFIARITP